MNAELVHIVILSASFLLLFGVAELLYHYLHVKAEITRKVVHICTGLLTLLFPVLLNSHWSVLLLCGSFAMLLIASLHFGFLPSINAIGRESVGSISYPVSVFICYLTFEFSGRQYLYFYCPILILAISDPAAALSGRRWPLGKYKVGNEHKSLMGSSFFFVTAFIVYMVLAVFCSDQRFGLRQLMSGAFIALITALAEAFSRKGYDNVSIPLTALLGLGILMYV